MIGKTRNWENKSTFDFEKRITPVRTLNQISIKIKKYVYHNKTERAGNKDYYRSRPTNYCACERMKAVNDWRVPAGPEY